MNPRFWITFERFDQPTPLNLGCGVTAESEKAAIDLVRAKVFRGMPFKIAGIIENVAISDLDQGHVIPNMGNPMMNGIWFPLGYS